MAQNQTSPHSSNYKLGGARIYVRRQGASAYNCLGNIVSPQLTPNISTLDHFTSWSGTRKRDRVEITSESYEFSFVLDEFTVDNLILALRSSAETTYAQSAATARHNAINVYADRAIKLDRRELTAGSVSVQTSGDTFTYTEYDPTTQTGDYIIDYRLGLITIPNGSSIANGQAVDVTFSCAAISGKSFNPGTLSGIQNIDGIIIAFLDNKSGVWVWEALNGTLQTNGNISLDDQNWSTMPMTISILATSSATAPYGNVYQWF